MNVNFRFLDQEHWSVYATINCSIILILLILCKQTLDLHTLIIVSLLGMMQGNLISKLIFTGFLSSVLFRKNMQWVSKTIIFLISVIIISYIPFNNYLQNIILNNTLFLWLFRLLILGWFIYIANLMRIS